MNFAYNKWGTQSDTSFISDNYSLPNEDQIWMQWISSWGVWIYDTPLPAYYVLAEQQIKEPQSKDNKDQSRENKPPNCDPIQESNQMTPSIPKQFHSNKQFIFKYH